MWLECTHANITQLLKKKKRIGAICSNMDEPREEYHTKWSKSYRERQI